jgi:hypothetical protein
MNNNYEISQVQQIEKKNTTDKIEYDQGSG